MSYQVLARKWRPQTFRQVVGQAHVLRALVNALETDRLHHAYLFTGTRGVGKTSLARVFAKSLNCETGVTSEPCGVCTSCQEVDEGRFVDLIEVDAASRTKVDETRELLDNVQYAATRGRYKVYLIDEVHMFSTHSFNALLKTLEEPPPHVKFLLATTDPKKLPVTILSRCLQFNLKRVPVADLVEHLTMITAQESVDAEPSAIAQLAQAADGSVRDALSLLDQAIAYGGGALTETDVGNMLGTIAGGELVKIVEALHANSGVDLLRIIRKLAETAPDFQYVLGELQSLLRRIAVAQALDNGVEEFEQSADVLRLATMLSREDVQLFYQIALVGQRDLSLAPDPLAGFEMLMLRMLAFQIDSGNSRAATVPVSSATKATTSAASATNAPSANDKESIAEAAIPDEGPALNEERTPPVRAAHDDGKQAASIRLDDELDWHSLVDRMQLDGMVRELARNANVTKLGSKVLELVVEPQHENLRADRLVRGLQQALSKQANMNVQIKVVVADSGSVDTVAKRMSEQERQRQQEAEAIIADDPTVQTLQAEFGATIESVSPR